MSTVIGHVPRAVSLRGLLSLVAGVVLVALVLPHVAAVPWASVGAALRAVPMPDLLALAALWLTGLLAHTVTLTAAMPPLTHRRALTLSLTGSAVANVLPLGGGAGVALNHRMSRTWGFDNNAFAVYTIVTNLWDVWARLCLPLVAFAWLTLSTQPLAPSMVAASAVAAAALSASALLVALVALSPRVALVAGRAADTALLTVFRLVGSGRRPALEHALPRLHRSAGAVIRSGWPRLTAGVVAYAVLTAALMWGCLTICGSGLPASAVFAGFALERVLSLLGLTPGGAGVVEIGVTGLLLALGGDPVGTVSGVLLYRLFTFGLEIPVGALGLVGWWWTHRQAKSAQGASA